MENILEDPGALKRAQITTENLRKQADRLRNKGVMCSLSGDKKNCVTGNYKGEPFAIYMRWVVASDGKFAGMLITRFKGRDWPAKVPYDLLRKEG